MLQQVAGAAIAVTALLAAPTRELSADAAAAEAQQSAVKNLADEVRDKG